MSGCIPKLKNFLINNKLNFILIAFVAVALILYKGYFSFDGPNNFIDAQNKPSRDVLLGENNIPQDESVLISKNDQTHLPQDRTASFTTKISETKSFHDSHTCNKITCKDTKFFGKGYPFVFDDLPEGNLKSQLRKLSPKSFDTAMKWLYTFTFPEMDAVESLNVDSSGAIYYVCKQALEQSTMEAPAADSAESTAFEEPVISTAAISVSNPPAFNSRPGAPIHIYLDFNGGVVRGTAWNNDRGDDVYEPKVWSLDSDRTTFSDSEQDMMRAVWEAVAEDFAPFEINVTTDVAYDPDNYQGDLNKVIWAMITPGVDANGLNLPHSPSNTLGVAYVGSIMASNNAYYMPVWAKEKSSAKTMAMTVSHEVGHTLRLSHDGTTNNGYYGGHGSGATSWSPIMGNGFNKNVSQWSKGEYLNYKSQDGIGSSIYNQPTDDDLANLDELIGYRPDDHGDTRSSATRLSLQSDNSFSENGLIGRTGETDVFQVDIPEGTLVVNVGSINTSTGTSNLDTVLELYNSSGSLLLSDNPDNVLTSSLAKTLPAGRYYLYVKPTGVGDPFNSPPSGYTIYGSLGQYKISGYLTDNRVPEADDILVTANENTATGITLTASDADGDDLTYSIVSSPLNGTLSGSGANRTYTPNANFFGSDSFTFKVNDGQFDSETAMVSIAVESLPNTPPTVDAGENQTVFLSASSTPLATSGADIILDAGQDNGANTTWEDTLGAWNLTIDGSVTFVADAGSTLPGITSAYDFPGGVSGSGGAYGSSFNNGWDNEPVSIELWFKPDSAGDDGQTNGQILFETGGGTGLGIFYNDGTIEVGHDSTEVISSVDVSSAISEFIQVVLTYDETNFILYVNGQSAASGTRTDTDWSGSDGAGLGARGASNTGGRGNGDAGTESFEGRIAIFRAYRNQVLTAPEVLANYYSITGGSTAVANLNGTVTDPDPVAPTTQWSMVSGPGPVFFSNGTSITSTATFTTAGVYTLRLTADDTKSQVSDDVVITVNEAGGNSAPVAGNGAITTNEDTAVNVTLLASDADGDSLSYIIVSGPSNGSLSGSGANRIYTPNAGFFGSDSFTFKVNDGTVDSNVATVSITINEVSAPNTPPSVDAGNPQTVTLTAGQGGGDPVAGFYYEWDAGQDTDGDANWTSTTANAYAWDFSSGLTPGAVNDSRFTSLTHAYDFPAAKDSSSTAWQGHGDQEPASFEFVIKIDGTNGSIFESGGKGDGIQVDIVNGVLRGTVEEDPTEARVSYTLTVEDMSRFVHVVFVADSANDLVQLYVDGELKDTQPWTTGNDWSGSGAASLGGFNGGPDGGSSADFTGKMALFRYYRNKAFNAADVTANFNALTGAAGGASATATLNGSASDDDDLTTSWSLISGPGSVSFGDTSSLTSTATFTVTGTYTLRLTANDGVNSPVSDDVVITVNEAGGNSAPVAGNGSVTTDENASAGVTLSASDADGDDLTYIIVTGPSNGILSGSGANRTYTPSANFFGSDSFTFKVNDGTVDSNTATVSIIVTEVVPTNTPPTVDAGNGQIIYLTNNINSGSSITLMPSAHIKVSDQTTRTSLEEVFPGEFTSSYYVQYHSRDHRRLATFVQFDLSSLPFDTVVSSAQFVVDYKTRAHEKPRTMAVMLGRNTQGSWDTSGTNNPLHDWGRDDETGAVNAELLRSVIADVSATAPVVNDIAVDVTQTVNNWISGTQSNDGFVLFSGSNIVHGAGLDNARLVITLDGAGSPSATANLAGTVTDPDNTPTVSWSLVSGPGSVSFSDASSPTSSATFTAAGAYTLRLTANDGVNSPVSDDVVITVSEPAASSALEVSSAISEDINSEIVIGGNGPLSEEEWLELSSTVDLLVLNEGTFTMVVTAESGTYKFNLEPGIVFDYQTTGEGEFIVKYTTSEEIMSLLNILFSDDPILEVTFP